MSRSPNAQRRVPIMPPLLPEETYQESGSAALFNGKSCEKYIQAFLLGQGINVAEPVVDDGKDLLFERSKNHWVRGQAKKITYRYKRSDKAKKLYDKDVFYPTFTFNFQRDKGSEKKNQLGPEDIHYFFHVLKTCYREIIWEIPSHLINLRKDGTFVSCNDFVLDSTEWIRNKRSLPIEDFVIFKRYDQKVFKAYPDFFLAEDKPTIEQFFV